MNNNTRYLFLLLVGLSLIFTPIVALADLPPRPTPPPTNTPDTSNDNDNDDDDPAPIGAYIHLSGHLSGGQTGAWSVVQWLGSDGNWHDVEGWRSSAAHNVIWWVAQKDFGTGPFRWAIYEQAGGKLVSLSPEFTLPAAANQSLSIVATSVAD